MATRNRRPRGRATAGVVLVAAVALGTLLAACGGSSADVLTVYNGQHQRPPTPWWPPSRRPTGITVARPQRRRGRAGQPDHRRGGGLPGRRGLHRELPGARGPRRPRACWPRWTPRPWPGCPPGTTRPQGDWVGVSARVSVMVYNTALVRPDQLPTSVSQLADPRWKGKLGLAAGRRTSSRSSPPTCEVRPRGHGGLAERLKSNAGRPHLPRQRDRDVDGERRAGGHRHHRLSTTGTACGPRWGRRACTRPWPSSPRTTRATSSTCRGRRCWRSSRTRPGPAVPGLPGQRPGPGDHRPQRQLRVPARLRVSPRPSRVHALRPAAAGPAHHRPAR